MLDDTQKENLYKSYRICEIINHFANIDIINSDGIFNDNFEESIKNIKNELLSITG